ncbi:50S ribosomal protein L10 [Zavarzinia sp. CC-PAN008]|uniref:50S ribosomal protein L10 n=1 Tax=Zavarzinia sp. CC-PAN008 TaxID=3243332 RepID=UPI003F74928F
MNRSEKQELVGHLGDVFSKAGVVVVTRNNGLTVAEITDLRRKMADAGAKFRVTKNRLTKLALEGTQIEHLSGHFTGPTAIAYSEDPVAAAKVVVEFAKKNEKLGLLGGALGPQALDADGVKALAALPSLDQLRASLLGLINTPATRIAGVVQAPAAQLARVFNAFAEKDAAADAAAA